MRNSKNYAGVAALLVLGTGYVLTGRVAVGVTLLVASGFVLAIVIASEASARYLILGSGAMLGSVVVACYAVSSEITGEATLYRGRYLGMEHVNRATAPEKFREANNLKWGICMFSAAGGITAFLGYRKLEEEEN